MIGRRKKNSQASLVKAKLKYVIIFCLINFIIKCFLFDLDVKKIHKGSMRIGKPEANIDQKEQNTHSEGEMVQQFNLNPLQKTVLSSTSGGAFGTIYKDEADRIIRRSFERTYAHIIPCDTTTGKECMLETQTYFQNSNRTAAVPIIPWWFRTLLRDVPTNGAYGSWHHFESTKPNVHFCSIEKVATSQWREVFCDLNTDDCVQDPAYCGKSKCTYHTSKEMPENAPWAVFLRDPLERLLSAYLNKCYNKYYRKAEEHCEPNIVFNPAEGLMNKKGKVYSNLAKHLEDRDKDMFGAFVDVMPLKWNLHFVPQAIICDLHRTISTYTFVGTMGKDFYFDLERMALKFEGPLSEVLNSTFGYLEHVGKNKHDEPGSGGTHPTHAPEKVVNFYTARTVRRALEYLSIDYLMLGMEVPAWAKRMLEEDTHSRKR